MKHLKFYENFNLLTNLSGEEIFTKYNNEYDYLSYYKRLFDKNYVEEDFNKVINILEDKCGQFLNELKSEKQYPIFRGSNQVSESNDKGIYYKNSYDKRKIKNSNVSITEIFDDLFYNKFGVKIRSTGIFSTKIIATADEYGPPYIFFPFDGYRYFWSNEVADFYSTITNKEWSNNFIYLPSETKNKDEEYIEEVTKEAKKEISNIVNTYEESNIQKVIRQEIIFLTKDYCLVDVAFLPSLIKYLEK